MPDALDQGEPEARKTGSHSRGRKRLSALMSPLASLRLSLLLPLPLRPPSPQAAHTAPTAHTAHSPTLRHRSVSAPASPVHSADANGTTPGTPGEEDDIDIALPYENHRPLYFANILTTAQIYAGLKSRPKRHEAPATEAAASADAVTDIGTAVGTGSDAETDAEYAADAAAADAATADAEAQRVMQERIDAAQRAHDNQGALNVDDEKLATLLESLARQESHPDLDRLYQAVVERDRAAQRPKDGPSKSGIMNPAKRGSLLGSRLGSPQDGAVGASGAAADTASPASAPATAAPAAADGDGDGDDAINPDTAELNPFQRSVLANLDPHFILESLLLKHKDKVPGGRVPPGETPLERRKRERLYLQIAEKLQRVFELGDDDYFYGNYNLWLIKDVLLQGHMYLTRDSILFFLFLPKRYERRGPALDSVDDLEDEVVQSGLLGMKTTKYGETVFTTVLTHRFWAVLRPDTLSIYSSATNLYFPSLVLDLNLCLYAEILDKAGATTVVEVAEPSPAASGGATLRREASPRRPRAATGPLRGTASPRGAVSPRGTSPSWLGDLDSVDLNDEEASEIALGGVWFKLVTTKKTYRFHTDNLHFARQWVNSLTKIIFQKNNVNSRNEVLLKIPIERVVDFDRSILFGGAAAEGAAGDDAEAAKSALYAQGAAAGAADAADAVVEGPPNSENFEQRLAAQAAEAEGAKQGTKQSGASLEAPLPALETPLPDASGPSQDASLSGTSPDDAASIPALQSQLVDLPTTFMVKYLINELVDAKTLSKLRIKSRFRSNLDKKHVEPGLEQTYFLFFNDSDRFFKCFQEIMSSRRTGEYETSRQHRLVERAKRMVKQPRLRQLSIADTELVGSALLLAGTRLILTLQRTDNKLMATIKYKVAFGDEPEDPSVLRKLTKTLTSPTRFFRSGDDDDGSAAASSATSGSTTSHLTVPSLPLPRLSSETHIAALSLSPKLHINLPKQLLLAGLKNLNMAFETLLKHVERYSSARWLREGDDEGTDAGGGGGDDDSSSISTRDSLMAPLNLADDAEPAPPKRPSKLQTLGKGIKAVGTMTNILLANPKHYVKVGDDDAFFVQSAAQREMLQRHYRRHFSVRLLKPLMASYICSLRKAIPIHGKLYLGEDYLCFRSLLPGVATKMILPLSEVEGCRREKKLKPFSGLTIVVKGYDELYIDFGLAKARDDCEQMLNWETLEDAADDDAILTPVAHGATGRIENARIKLFEDKLNAAAGLDIPIMLEDLPFFKTEIRPTQLLNFTLLTIGLRGDVQPYIALARGLMAEGHNVTIATHREFGDWVREHRIAFEEVAGDPTELMLLMVTHGLILVAFIKEASAKFKGWIADLLDTSWRACQHAKTDILIESPLAMAGLHIAEAMGIPYFRAFTMPWLRTRAYPHAFIVPDQRKGGSYNYLTHVMFETVFWKGILGPVNRWRVEELGIPRTNLIKMQQLRVPFLYNISPTIFPPSVDFPDWVKVTGYWFLDEGGDEYKPPHDIARFIESARRDGKKLVYIGFGSIVVKDAASLTRAIIEAVKESDVRCILNKGWSDRLLEKKEDDDEDAPDCPEIYNTGSVPHDWLFPRIDAAVHHGGSGTTGASLRAGLPTVIKPFFGDQFFYASRVEEIGVGLALRKLNAKLLAKCLRTATTDAKMQEKALKTKERIRHENGVMNAIECIYSELEYARDFSLSKQKDYGSIGLGVQTPVVWEEDDDAPPLEFSERLPEDAQDAGTLTEEEDVAAIAR